MTTAQDQFVDIAQRSQETVTKAIKSWTDTVQEYTLNLTSGQHGLPSTVDVVNNMYDFAEQVLHTQREFATSLLAAGSEVTEATRKATEQASQKATEAARKVTEETKAATARATRSDGAK